MVQPIEGGVYPALTVESIQDTNTNHTICRGVYIGTAQDIDLYINEAWVLFQGVIAGSILPVQATGARKNSDGEAPASGDIVFLH